MDEKMNLIFKKKRCKNFIVFLTLRRIIAHISRCYINKKNYFIWIIRCRYFAQKVKLWYQRLTGKLGISVRHRSRKFLVHNLTFSAALTYMPIAYQRGQYMVKWFLFKKVVSYEFVLKLRDTFFQIKFIQSKFRNLREIMRQRAISLRTTILS